MDERIKRAAREAMSLSREQVAAGIRAMVVPMEKLGGTEAAKDVARNVAQVLITNVALGEEVPSCVAVAAALTHRRNAFPRGPWGKLTDGQIDAVSALAAYGWEHAVRAARAGRAA